MFVICKRLRQDDNTYFMSARGKIIVYQLCYNLLECILKFRKDVHTSLTYCLKNI